MQKLKSLKHCSGSALAGAVAICAILGIAIAGLMGISRNTVSQEADAYDDTRAFLAAESGLHMLTNWVLKAAGSNAVKPGITEVPLQINSPMPGNPAATVPVKLEISQANVTNPKAGSQYWRLMAAADVGLAYSTMVEWVVEVGAGGGGAWNDLAVWAGGNLVWNNSYNINGNSVIGGNLTINGSGSQMSGKTWIDGNLTTHGNLINSGDLRVGKNLTAWSNAINNAWVGGSISGPTVSSSNDILGADAPKPPILDMTKIGNVTPIPWSDDWSNNFNGNWGSPFKSAIDGALPKNKYIDADGNEHVIIKITSAAGAYAWNGGVLNANVIFIVEGNNASFTTSGFYRNTNKDYSTMIYVGAGNPKLNITVGDNIDRFNGLIYVDEKNVSDHSIEFAGGNFNVHGAVYAMGTGQTTVTGNSSVFNFDGGILNRYTGLTAGGTDGSNNPAGILSRTGFKTTYAGI
ncbi:MAG: hypothetical protein FWB94_11365 [Chitinispirillia bacterium]|nr:hypothetical protein [Chitinispirillia bacterium]